MLYVHKMQLQRQQRRLRQKHRGRHPTEGLIATNFGFSGKPLRNVFVQIGKQTVNIKQYSESCCGDGYGNEPTVDNNIRSKADQHSSSSRPRQGAASSSQRTFAGGHATGRSGQEPAADREGSYPKSNGRYASVSRRRTAGSPGDDDDDDDDDGRSSIDDRARDWYE